MLQSGGNGLDARFLQSFHRLFGTKHCGAIHVLNLQAKQGVADSAANKAHLASLGIKRRQQLRQSRPVAPWSVRQIHGFTALSRRDRFMMIEAVTPQIR